MAHRIFYRGLAVVFCCSAAVYGCSNNGPPTCAGDHLVTLSWAENHEHGVNSPGGGYRVTIGNQPPVAVAYRSGPATPSTLVACLPSGTFKVTVRAFARLDARGGQGGSQSESTPPLTITVPAPADGMGP